MGASGEPEKRGQPVVRGCLRQLTVGSSPKPERYRESIVCSSGPVLQWTLGGGTWCSPFCRHNVVCGGRPVTRPAVVGLGSGLPTRGLVVAGGRPLVASDALLSRRKSRALIDWLTGP
ncbi:hypothetical protein NDU88_001304 [Pleurodeles waltl]|uniref:Uncharacterized protein n=1 Tax=Pleurodeles waltl TaxID=8319 RepID=A0AAV7P5E2_PLEWA|nr:hypothetical protein NDU88_001304 [Pleurodeles waltl]